MASGRFAKTGAPYLVTKINSALSDSTIGGTVSTSPAAISQFEQNLPGDRYIFSPSDALAVSNTTVGTLYTGTYRYVASLSTSSSSPARAHGAFWFCNNDTGAGSNAQDALYQVTSDEAANHTVTLFAGVFINNMTKGNYWFIQESGKTSCKFATTITAPTPAIGYGVYLYAGGNNNNAADVGSFDQLYGATAVTIAGNVANNAVSIPLTYNAFDNMFTRFVGVAEGTPSNNNISLVDLTLSRASFRW